MTESKFGEYWNQAQFCYFKSEAAKGPASKHLWMQMAQDWIALADPIVLQPDEQNVPGLNEELELFIAA